MFENCKALASTLGKSIVSFDIEHSGGAKDRCGVLEFGAIELSQSGQISRYSTLLNPGDVDFNPYATKVHRITPKKVANAPRIGDACAKFIADRHASFWLGFNSKSCDIPKLQQEHKRFGLVEPAFTHHLDVMKFARHVAGMRGSLSAIVGSIPTGRVFKAHKAIDDAEMTLILFDHLLSLASPKDMRSFGIARKHTGDVSLNEHESAHSPCLCIPR